MPTEAILGSVPGLGGTTLHGKLGGWEPMLRTGHMEERAMASFGPPVKGGVQRTMVLTAVMADKSHINSGEDGFKKVKGPRGTTERARMGPNDPNPVPGWWVPTQGAPRNGSWETAGDRERRTMEWETRMMHFC